MTSRPIVGSSRKTTRGFVQEGRGNFAFHPLTEREIADRFVNQRLELQEFREFTEYLAVIA